MITPKAIATLLGLLGLALMIVILLRRASRRRARMEREQRREASRGEAGRYSHPLADAPPEAVRWHVEMHELARDLKGEIDSKLVALQTALALVRHEADRLEALLDRLEHGAGRDATDARNEIEQLRRPPKHEE